jgi:cytochrome c-type biogenesis protein CcmH/NrfG
MLDQLSSMNERTWLQIGQLSEMMKEPERAIAAYESALRHNPYSKETLTLVAAVCRACEKYAKVSVS